MYKFIIKFISVGAVIGSSSFRGRQFAEISWSFAKVMFVAVL